MNNLRELLEFLHNLECEHCLSKDKILCHNIYWENELQIAFECQQCFQIVFYDDIKV
jgi:hypothetical protein